MHPEGWEREERPPHSNAPTVGCCRASGLNCCESSRGAGYKLMITFLCAVAILLGIALLAYLASRRASFKVLEGLSSAGRRTYRVLACVSMVVSAALVYALRRVYQVSVEPGEFYITTSWSGYLGTYFMLWLILSGLLCMVATNLIMGGYVNAKPKAKRGYTMQQEASLAASRWASEVAAGNPLVPLVGFATIGLVCLIGIGIMQGRYVRSTGDGLAHMGAFDLYEDVLKWEDVDRLSLVRSDDPDKGPYTRWILVWTDTEGAQLMKLENRNIWSLMPNTINATVAHHRARGIEVEDPRPEAERVQALRWK